MASGDDLTSRLRRHLSRELDLPLYRRLSVAIEADIDAGDLREGDLLPGERVLAEALDLSRVTVRSAIDALVDAGRLRRRHGARTEVAGRLEKALSALTSFSEDMLSRGKEPGFRWIGKELSRPSPAEMMALGIPAAQEVWRLARVRTADGHAIAREVSSVPARYLAGADLIDGSLYKALATVGAMPVRALQRLRAATATVEDREELGCGAAAPILEVERRCFLPDGAVVEFSRSRYRGDIYDFVVELTR